MKEYCLTFTTEDRRLSSWDEQKEMDDAFETSKDLEFIFAKIQLLDFMGRKPAAPGSRMELPSTWGISDPIQLFDALQTLNMNVQGAQFHKNNGQMKLWS